MFRLARRQLVIVALFLASHFSLASPAGNPDYKAYWGDYDDDGFLDVLLMPQARLVAFDLWDDETSLHIPLIISADREARVIKTACSAIPFGQHGQLGCYQAIRRISQQEIDEHEWQEGYDILWGDVEDEERAFLFVWSRVPGLASFKIPAAALVAEPGLTRLTFGLHIERGIPDLGAATITVKLDDRTGDGLDDLVVLSAGIPADIYPTCPDCSGQASLTFLLPGDLGDHEELAAEVAKIVIDNIWASYCESLEAGSLDDALGHFSEAGRLVYSSILAELGADVFASLPRTWSDPVFIDLQDRTATIVFDQNENGVIRTYSVTLVRGAGGWRIDQM